MKRKKKIRTSVVVQWLRLCASNAWGKGSVPAWRTKVPHATKCSQEKKKKKNPKMMKIVNGPK